MSIILESIKHHTIHKLHEKDFLFFALKREILVNNRFSRRFLSFFFLKWFFPDRWIFFYFCFVISRYFFAIYKKVFLKLAIDFSKKEKIFPRGINAQLQYDGFYFFFPDITPYDFSTWKNSYYQLCLCFFFVWFRFVDLKKHKI